MSARGFFYSLTFSMGLWAGIFLLAYMVWALVR